ncbi:MAG TPA: hypothetical protein VFA44_01025 [Gaiellaceae bacterium]|nr:hypothetical protein [Gaiellaceae bacterium]
MPTPGGRSATASEPTIVAAHATSRAALALVLALATGVPSSRASPAGLPTPAALLPHSIAFWSASHGLVGGGYEGFLGSSEQACSPRRC